MQVTIRPLEEQDAYISYRWRNDPEVFKYTGNTYSHEITLQCELDWIRRVTTNLNDYRCAIIADGQYVGNIYLTDIHNAMATYHIFIGDKSWWGKGVAKQASQLIIEYAARHLCLQIIHLKVKKENTRAIRLYQSLGFVVSQEQPNKQSSDWIHMQFLIPN